MKQYTWILLATAMIACSGGDKEDEGATDEGGTDTPVGDDDDDVTGDDDDDGCANQVISQFPMPGEPEAFFQSNVRFQLAAEDSTATIAVADAGGAAVSGSSSSAGATITWEGDDFMPSTDYVATLTYECGTEELAFTTSEVGEPVVADLTGRAFSLDLQSGEFVTPAGVGEILGDQLDGIYVFFQVQTVGADIQMLGALGATATTQELCYESLNVPPAIWVDPSFELTADELPLAISALPAPVTINDLELTGSFSPAGDYIQGARLAGLIDTRPLAPLVDAAGTNENALCEFISIVGVDCIACPDGSGDFCLEIEVEDIEAEYVPSLTLVERSIDDINADSTCDDF